MKNYYKFALLLVIALFMGFKAANADEIAFEKGSFNEVLQKAKEQNKIVMIDFVTDWCIWCKHLDMRVYNNKKVVRYAEEHQINWKTDAEKEGKDLAKKYGVSGYPTLV
ncbi:MAG: thioredoxin family protein, partial [Bacteroidetes bacterium]|nr:thioredoxin family protein [Bacteroidota bacterium]